MACCAAAKALVVLTFVSRVKFARGREKGVFRVVRGFAALALKP